MPGISIHVVDVSRGLVASGMRVELWQLAPRKMVASGTIRVIAPAIATLPVRAKLIEKAMPKCITPNVADFAIAVSKQESFAGADCPACAPDHHRSWQAQR